MRNFNQMAKYLFFMAFRTTCVNYNFIVRLNFVGSDFKDDYLIVSIDSLRYFFASHNLF